MLSWPPGPGAPLDPGAVREALSAGRRGHAVVVVDLPRSTAPLLVETAARCALVVVVVRPSVTGVAAAARWVAAMPDEQRFGLLVRGTGADPRRVAELVGASRRRLDGRPAGAGRGARPGARAGPLAARSPSPGRPVRCSPDWCPRRWRHEPRTWRRSSRRWIDRVRSRLADRPGELSPHRVAEALREAGRPVGDATVLAVYESLCRDVLGAGPLEPLLRLPGVTDVLVNGPHPGLRRPRRRASKPPAAAVHRRRRSAPTGPAVGRAGGSAARRRLALRRRAAARRECAARGAGAGRAGRHAASRCASRGAGLHPPRAGRRGTVTPHGADLLEPAGRLPPRVPGQRRHRHRQDDAAVGAPLTRRPWAAAGAGRGRRRAAARPPARRRGSRAAGQRRGRRRDRRCATWSATRCGCDPTGWWSARCADLRSSTCSPPSTPGTRADAARSTPTRRPTRPAGSRRSRWPPGSTGRRPTASWRPGSPR